MRSLVQDVRYAFRQFLKSPGFAVSAILSLMLGVGATTAIFSVVYGVLLDPYPYKDANRMIHVELRDKNGRGPLLIVNGSQARELRKASSIDDFFLQDEKRENLTGDKFPVSVLVGLYSPNVFEYMGVPPLVGREFSSADAPGGNPAPVVVLSYLFWQRQYGASRDVIGSTIQLDHVPYTVIGVVPPRFTWGDDDVYVPALPTADPHYYWLAFVKLKPGTKYPAAQAEMQILVDRFAKEDPKGYPQNMLVKIVTLNEEVLGHFAGTLVFLFGAVVVLLLIGCANVSILLLARGTARQHEFAVRTSVGAGRGRLIRQLLTESLLLSVTGAALGVLAAFWGVKALSTMLPYYSFPHEAAIHVNGMVLIFSAAIAILTGILFGISPAYQLSKPQLGALIQASSAKLTGSTHSRNTHRLLIAGQVALTLLLLAGAGGAVRAFTAKVHTPLGFDPDHVFALNIDSPKGATSTWQDRIAQNELVRQAVAQSPGVAEVGVSTTWFPGFGGFNAKIEIQSKPTLTDAQAVLTLISPQLLSTLHIPLFRGRIFDDAESRRAAHLAMVNQAFVTQYLGGADPIGQSVRSPQLKFDQANLFVARAPDDWLEVIGVVGRREERRAGSSGEAGHFPALQFCAAAGRKSHCARHERSGECYSLCKGASARNQCRAGRRAGSHSRLVARHARLGPRAFYRHHFWSLRRFGAGARRHWTLQRGLLRRDPAHARAGYSHGARRAAWQRRAARARLDCSHAWRRRSRGIVLERDSEPRRNILGRGEFAGSFHLSRGRLDPCFCRRGSMRLAGVARG